MSQQAYQRLVAANIDYPSVQRPNPRTQIAATNCTPSRFLIGDRCLLPFGAGATGDITVRGLTFSWENLLNRGETADFTLSLPMEQWPAQKMVHCDLAYIEVINIT